MEDCISTRNPRLERCGRDDIADLVSSRPVLRARRGAALRGQRPRPRRVDRGGQPRPRRGRPALRSLAQRPFLDLRGLVGPQGYPGSDRDAVRPRTSPALSLGDDPPPEADHGPLDGPARRRSHTGRAREADGSLPRAHRTDAIARAPRHLAGPADARRRDSAARSNRSGTTAPSAPSSA